ncbi:TetR/AcrR family transcriptional regulator [Nonomuraea diastatica]|uniref:TetR/AcrR family transcriptional regulator n=1 Tax=Nonomuraea diastatica TaxID=1848329 RepID=A0A4R4WML7_9ACTN|nr:TetR/AcrR family transcriptional regulator [Nonomuraea diastatica]TDD17763.1 TetR/AcrR family transcriptional regulator [Nonomuraea diastatica]
MENQTGRRRYNSLRRVTQAKQTRAEIAGAARRLFLSQGWAATTVRDVAREAGVAVPTVYAAYQNKAGLVWALADAADLAAGLPQMIDELEATTDPRRHLAAMAGYDRRLFERAGDLIALIRDAGRTEPELADFYRLGRRQVGEYRIQVFSSWPDGTLRPGLDAPTAVDIYAALCTIDVYTILRTERSWSPDRIERWWGEALARKLLSRPAGAP